MSSYERRIDALAGTPVEGASKYDEGYVEGHNDALTGAMEIAAEADATIAELIEAIEAITNPTGRRAMSNLIDDAEALIGAVSRTLAA